MENEIWKPVVGYEGLYEVSDLGKVRLLKRNIILKQSNRGGYKRVWLFNGVHKSQHSVHRLVLCAFVPNVYNKPEVNHKDLKKDNNRLENLEWCTPKENIDHAVKNYARKPYKMKEDHKKKIRAAVSRPVIDTKTGIVFSCVTEAANELGMTRSTLAHYLLGTRKNKTSMAYFESNL